MFGTVRGTVGLIAFGLVIWLMGPSHSTWLVLAVATVAWFVGALSTWELRRLLHQQKARHHETVKPIAVRQRK